MASIGKSIAINGDLTGNEDMVIEGSVEGNIDLAAVLAAVQAGLDANSASLGSLMTHNSTVFHEKQWLRRK